jgi:hypothetical protein
VERAVPDTLERVRAYALPGQPGGAWGTRLRQRGEIRLNLDRPWRSFEAEEQIDARKLEFQWAAKLKVAPFTSTKVTEAYEEGHGRVEGRLFGVGVQRSSGAEIDVSELTRLLSELVWCPLALSHPWLDFDAVDSHTLKVALKRGPAPVEVTMEVDDEGRVLDVQAKGRPRLIGNATLATDWFGSFTDYREFGGMRMPARCDHAWALPDGRFHYFRSEVVEARLLTGADPARNPAQPAGG